MNLRELLKDMALEDKVISQSAFRLLQGLVEAVEPGNTDEVGMSPIAIVHKLHKELDILRKDRDEATAARDSWERQCRKAEYGTAEALRVAGRRAKESDIWRARCLASEHDLAEALRAIQKAKDD